ncbi:MAG: tRNA pseudouridine(38-40) synthase TruA [Deltaproteobacteria bacterium]|nr:MAG: tRNA pseudouridine(38-40) synthase TruA [Deltaproteobacteria bacterium]
MERRFKLVLEYDGADFVGWEVQRSGRSVQSEIEGALARILQHPVRVEVSGRTDAGVHAEGQVAAFTTRVHRSTARIRDGLNAVLPLDVACREVQQVPLDFDPRRQARTKHYRYRWLDSRVRSPLRRGRVWQVRRPLDAEAMAVACGAFEGTHDFSAFRASGCGARTTVRTFPAWSVRRVDDEIWLDAHGHGFLRHTIRIVAGTLVEVGRGAREAAWVSEVLRSGSRAMAGPTAPAHGLTLLGVRYDGSVASEPS